MKPENGTADALCDGRRPGRQERITLNDNTTSTVSTC